MSQERRKDYSYKIGNITIPIHRTEARCKKNGAVYTAYVVSEYQGGQRKQKSFAKLEDAKSWAADIAAKFITGHQPANKTSVLPEEIQKAIDAVAPTGVSI